MPRNDQLWTVKGDGQRAAAAADQLTDLVAARRALAIIERRAFGATTDPAASIIDPDGAARRTADMLARECRDADTAALAIELATARHARAYQRDGCGPRCCQLNVLPLTDAADAVSVSGITKTRPGFATADRGGVRGTSGADVWRQVYDADAAKLPRFMAQRALAVARWGTASIFWIATSGIGRNPDTQLPKLRAAVQAQRWVGHALALACHPASTALGITPIPHGEGTFEWPSELGPDPVSAPAEEVAEVMAELGEEVELADAVSMAALALIDFNPDVEPVALADPDAALDAALDEIDELAGKYGASIDAERAE